MIKLSTVTLQNATDCFCGNNLGRNGAWKTSNTACSARCVGYTSSFDPPCGGPGAVTIYRAGTPNFNSLLKVKTEAQFDLNHFTMYVICIW